MIACDGGVIYVIAIDLVLQLLRCCGWWFVRACVSGGVGRFADLFVEHECINFATEVRFGDCGLCDCCVFVVVFS